MLYCYVLFLLVLSIAVLLMPLGANGENPNNVFTYLSGGIFWLGFIGVIVTSIYITVSKNKDKDFKKTYTKRRKFGLTHFFQNKYAFVCDVFLFVSIIAFLITSIFLGTTILPFLFLSLLIFSFGMHCMLNGSNYIYINYKVRRETESCVKQEKE